MRASGVSRVVSGSPAASKAARTRFKLLLIALYVRHAAGRCKCEAVTSVLDPLRAGPHICTMTIASQLTTLPRAFDPAMGEDARARVPSLESDLQDLIAGAAGSAPYLFDLLRHEADWLPGALEDPEGARDEIIARLAMLDHDKVEPGL